MSESFRNLIESNRSTLFFTNSRRLAEKMTLKINEDQPAPLAYAHHGSLARDIRTEVEKRLKGGELGAIVATSSLELGIDIGDLDEVVLVQSPPSVAAALQRIGRAGHGVGEVSRGTLYPTHAHDFLEAAVLADAVAERDIEPLRPLTGSLDVLCQTIVSMCANETWGIDAMFAVIRSSSPYRNLPREHFDLVLDMLAGRYAAPACGNSSRASPTTASTGRCGPTGAPCSPCTTPAGRFPTAATINCATPIPAP